MADNIKDILLVVFFLLNIVLAVLFFKGRQERSELMDIQLEQNAIIEYTENKYGEEVASKKAIVASLKILKQTHKQQLDSLRRRFELKVRNLEAALSAQVTTTGTDTVTVVHTDTVIQEVTKPMTTFNYADKWLELSGKIIDDNLTLNWRYYEDLDFVVHKKKGGLFKQREYLVSAISNNPNSEVTGLSYMRVAKPKTRFGIGIYTGYGTRGVDVGIGVYYSLYNF